MAQINQIISVVKVAYLFVIIRDIFIFIFMRSFVQILVWVPSDFVYTSVLYLATFYYSWWVTLLKIRVSTLIYCHRPSMWSRRSACIRARLNLGQSPDPSDQKTENLTRLNFYAFILDAHTVTVVRWELCVSLTFLYLYLWRIHRLDL